MCSFPANQSGVGPGSKRNKSGEPLSAKFTPDSCNGYYVIFSQKALNGVAAASGVVVPEVCMMMMKRIGRVLQLMVSPSVSASRSFLGESFSLVKFSCVFRK